MYTSSLAGLCDLSENPRAISWVSLFRYVQQSITSPFLPQADMSWPGLSPPRVPAQMIIPRRAV